MAVSMSLSRAIRLAHQGLDRAYRDMTPPVTMPQLAILEALAEKRQATQSELVDATGIDRSTMANVLLAMIGRGLVVREVSETDNRAKLVSLTAKGNKDMRVGRRALEIAEAAIAEPLPHIPRKAFIHAVEIMAAQALKGRETTRRRIVRQRT